jgi:SAM-dependent methyltransferase
MDKIPPQKIEEIYNNFIKINYTEEYKNRYNPLPLHKNTKNWKWEGKDFPRIIALLEFERYVEKYDFKIDKLLLFNGLSDPELEYLDNRVKSITNVEYGKDTENNDVHSLCLPEKNYDFAMINQTFEHLYNPQQCLNNIKAHLKNDGYLYVNVPACNVPHSEPYHYFTGYTPMGLAAAAFQVGFEILEIGQWGNLEYLIKLWSRNPGWSDYTQLQVPGLNEPHNPVITWGLFRKKNTNHIS